MSQNPLEVPRHHSGLSSVDAPDSVENINALPDQPLSETQISNLLLSLDSGFGELLEFKQSHFEPLSLEERSTHLLLRAVSNMFLDLFYSYGFRSCDECLILPCSSSICLNLLFNQGRIENKNRGTVVIVSQQYNTTLPELIIQAALIPSIVKRQVKEYPFASGEEKPQYEGICLETEQDMIEEEVKKIGSSNLSMLLSLVHPASALPLTSDPVSVYSKIAQKYDVPHFTLVGTNGLDKTVCTELEEAGQTGRIDGVIVDLATFLSLPMPVCCFLTSKSHPSPTLVQFLSQQMDTTVQLTMHLFSLLLSTGFDQFQDFLPRRLEMHSLLRRHLSLFFKKRNLPLLFSSPPFVLTYSLHALTSPLPPLPIPPPSHPTSSPPGSTPSPTQTSDDVQPSPSDENKPPPPPARPTPPIPKSLSDTKLAAPARPPPKVPLSIIPVVNKPKVPVRPPTDVFSSIKFLSVQMKINRVPSKIHYGVDSSMADSGSSSSPLLSTLPSSLLQSAVTVTIPFGCSEQQLGRIVTGIKKSVTALEHRKRELQGYGPVPTKTEQDQHLALSKSIIASTIHNTTDIPTQLEQDSPLTLNWETLLDDSEHVIADDRPANSISHINTHHSNAGQTDLVRCVRGPSIQNSYEWTQNHHFILQSINHTNSSDFPLIVIDSFSSQSSSDETLQLQNIPQSETLIPPQVERPKREDLPVLPPSQRPGGQSVNAPRSKAPARLRGK
ncbi:hypothetical protein BLNAU_783 [Blattamonas nauphoetae]|uniref:O-phosphoseryl-tRNA(Sec) selenium transferase n=1 Tax=Blattamonas nauphoetae TaxID=2049346 RepID=A0ABQ9YKH4_9EUKA|nr:hypothetical protein BLNAU_783 [Blattamonas nauphoetae]